MNFTRYSVIISIMRKHRSLKILMASLLFFSVLTNFSCKNDDKTGMNVLSADDEMLVGTDTFSLSSDMIQAFSIPSDPDSFLLGNADSYLGTIHADIITQMSCPEGYKFPDNSILDSAILTLYFDSWYGDGNSPMSVNVYQLDKKTLEYDSLYNTDIMPSDYCSFADSTNVAESVRIFTASNPTDSFYSSSSGKYIKAVRVKLSSAVISNLYNGGSYISQEQFNQVFKGFYITSDFGSATVLYIDEMAVSLYYHMTYSLSGKDTTITDYIDFYANDEIRTVNRIIYDTPDDFYDFLLRDSTISYVASPAHLYTIYNIPLRDVALSIRDSILSGKRTYVNSAKIKVYATNYTTAIDVNDVSQWSQPPSHMMLIEADQIETFFTSRSLPNDTSAILSQLIVETDSVGSTSAYYYYDLSTLLTRTLRASSLQDTLSMVLVPVSIEQTSTSSSSIIVSSVRPLQTISSTVVNTQYNEQFPLRLSVVATGL